MSHDEKGRILSGGNGTITLTPDAATKIYPNQGRFITATIKMSGSNIIPPGATIDFSGSTNGESKYFTLLPYQHDVTAVPVQITEGDNTTGTATLGIRHDPKDKTNTIVVNAQAGAGWTTKPSDAQTVTYTVQAHDPVITCTGPSETMLPIPTAQDGDRLTPGATRYVTQFTCKVTDSGNPVKDYVIEWHESAEHSLGLFSGLMNAYVSATATYADRLQSGNALLVEDKAQQGYFVRMTTGADGTANLYLVAINSTGAIAQGVRALYNFSATDEHDRPFLVVNPTDTFAGFSELMPTVEAIEANTLYYDDLQNPPYVSVLIPSYPGNAPGDRIYLLVNGQIAAGPYHSPMTENDNWNSRFLESIGYSDIGPNAGKENEALFIVSNIESGLVKPSLINAFLGQGNNQGPIIQTDGTLDAPELVPLAGVINAHTLQAPPVAIKVDLDQSETNGWTAQIGDMLTATAVLTGYKPNSDVLNQSISVAANPFTVVDLTSATVELQFPSVDPFKGWDRMKDSPYTEGHCYIIYTVQRAGVPNQSSQVLTLVLNTADMSY
ncbi:hypothetical protein [Trinickia acidisoli]|uniref:hypothetical protein n=1 Tax=Trinickia acidisoli TaxID=2767482 RepID=UPI001A903033|nr:hypothetical protein [Trinickia acidisoli]